MTYLGNRPASPKASAIDFDYLSAYAANTVNMRTALDSVRVETYTDLQNISIADAKSLNRVVVLGRSSVGDGAEGDFRWNSSNLSTEVSNDSEEGIYIAPSEDLTGASGAWVRILENYISPHWYGGTFSGTASENLTALQAAFDAGVSESLPVLLPGQSIEISNTLRFDSDLIVLGSANRTSEIKGAFDGPLLQSEGSTTSRRYNFTFKNARLNCTDTTTYPNAVGLDLRNATDCIVEGVQIVNAALGVQFFADSGLGCYYNTLINVNASTCTIGFQFLSLGNENRLIGCRAVDVDEGVRHSGGSHNHLINCAIETFDSFGIRVTGGIDLFIASPRLENPPTLGVGISIGGGHSRAQIVGAQYTGLTTDLSDSGVNTIILGRDGLKVAGDSLITGHIREASVIDFPSISAQSTNDQLVSISGVTTNDSCFVTPDPSVAAGLMFMAIPTTGGVYVRAANITSSPIDPASGTFIIDVWQH